MTDTEITQELTPGQRRMAAAHATRRRMAESGWADRLRERGWAVIEPTTVAAVHRWAVIEPTTVAAVHRSGTDHEPGERCEWCNGYRAALADVLGK